MAVLAFIYNCLAMKCVAKQISAVSIGTLSSFFYMIMVLFIYISRGISEFGEDKKEEYFICFLVWNLVLFIVRISLDLALIEYRQEGYAVKWGEDRKVRDLSYNDFKRGKPDVRRSFIGPRKTSQPIRLSAFDVIMRKVYP